MDEIVVAPYDPSWPAKYEQARRFVEACFAEPPLAIEHIGSTAVPGLAAKPVIDVLVLVDDLSKGLAAVPALEAGGYSFWRDNPDKTKLYLVKGLPPSAPQRTHHLHIYADRAELDRHLVFRDALRADSALRDAYAALKYQLAAQFRDDRDGYSRAKTAFVDEVVAQARGPSRPLAARAGKR